MKRLQPILFIFSWFSLLLVSCDVEKMEKKSMDLFQGVWELKGRTIFEDVQIKIEKNEIGQLKGKVVKLNNNKYVQMFVEIGDPWITEIKRRSNYEFTLSEKKIASQLFAVYGQSTTAEFKVQFIDEDTFGLGSDDENPKETGVVYSRVR